MNIGVILAGGHGTRLGATDSGNRPIPKQFVEVFGKPVVAYTLEIFQKHPEIDAIEVVCVKECIPELERIVQRFSLAKVKWITPGGSSFLASVMNGVNNLKGEIDDKDILLFHFAASPFVTPEIISDCIRVTKEKGTAISTTDYVLLSGKKEKTTSVEDPANFSSTYINRDTVAVMNSPHGFRMDYICELYQEAVATGAINRVEPHTTTLMYALGRNLYFSKGSQTNIKITRKEDLELFKAYCFYKKPGLI